MYNILRWQNTFQANFGSPLLKRTVLDSILSEVVMTTTAAGLRHVAAGFTTCYNTPGKII
jgi:hypothetical protein